MDDNRQMRLKLELIAEQIEIDEAAYKRGFAVARENKDDAGADRLAARLRAIERIKRHL